MSIVLSFLQSVIVGGALQDARATGVVVWADDVQLRAMASNLIKEWNSEMNVTDGEEPEAAF